jgi:hypothetical protein
MASRLGPAAGVLARAAQQGPQAFVVAYEMLRQEQPEIDQLVSEDQEQEDGLISDEEFLQDIGL